MAPAANGPPVTADLAAVFALLYRGCFLYEALSRDSVTGWVAVPPGESVRGTGRGRACRSLHGPREELQGGGAARGSCPSSPRHENRPLWSQRQAVRFPLSPRRPGTTGAPKPRGSSSAPSTTGRSWRPCPAGTWPACWEPGTWSVPPRWSPRCSTSACPWRLVPGWPCALLCGPCKASPRYRDAL